MLGQQIRRFTEAALIAKGEQPPSEAYPFHPSEVKFIQMMVADEMEELFEANDLGEQADALADAIIYMMDAAARKGIDLDQFIRIAHAANMKKIVRGRVIIETEGERAGKILKPDGWESPDAHVEAEAYRQSVGLYGHRPGMVYVASPYSHVAPTVMAQRYEDVMEHVWGLTMMFPHTSFYSPIVHFHNIAEKFQMPTDYTFWKGINHASLRRADEMIVACIDGWEDSVGIQGEIQYAKSIGLQVRWTVKDEENNRLEIHLEDPRS